MRASKQATVIAGGRDGGRKGSSLLAMKMQGTNRSGEGGGGREEAMVDLSYDQEGERKEKPRS